MRFTPTRLLFRKKITAVFADGSSKCILGIATVVRMLQGAANVPVEVAADAAARKLLDELAKRRADRRTGLRGDIPNVTRQATGQGATGCPSRPNCASWSSSRGGRGGTAKVSSE